MKGCAIFGLSSIDLSRTARVLTHSDRYTARGVSSTKDEVHEAIKKLDKGLYANAFCKILPDIAAGDGEFCNILHADTAGTKASLAYIYWKETGDLSVWHGIAQDAIVMNLDDMGCVGCIDNFLLSNTITRNKHRIPGEVISAVIEGTVEFCNRMAEYGVSIHNAGGETADVGDIVRTIDVGFTAFGRMSQKDLIVNDIREGDVIVGLGSFGKATYESEYNSGIGSNGLTSARHDVLANQYASKYPESFSNETDAQFIYSGTRNLTDTLEVEGEEIHVGKLLLSPTRSFLPVLRKVLEELQGKIHGLIHCTGGGQTKVSKFLPENVTALKNNLFDTPPLFKLIQSESETGWKEMYQVFNMGVRLEVYLNASDAQTVIDIARSFNIPAQVIGEVVKGEEHQVRLETPYGSFRY